MGESPPRALARCHLENLPAELIQEIFLHCLEFNLPRASVYVARVLSHPLLYTWLVRLAFSSSNPSSTRAFFSQDFLPPPLDYFALSARQRRDLQNDILNTRWCTLPFIRKCQREYIERALQYKCHHLDFFPEHREILSDLSRAFDDACARNNTHFPRNTISPSELLTTAHDPTTKNDYNVAIWFIPGIMQVRKANRTIYREKPDCFRLPWCSPDAPPCIPDKYLHPPWTADKLGFLELLVNAGAYIDDECTFARSRRVLRQVIRDRDFATFERLVNLEVRPEYHRGRVPWPVLPNHFQVALKYAGTEDTMDPFLRLLVERRWDNLAADQVKLKEEVMARLGMNQIKIAP